MCGDPYQKERSQAKASKMAASLLLSLLVLLSVCWTPQGMLLGGQTPIQKLDDPEVTKAASFAVQALNKDTSSTSEDNLIVLVSVEKGTMQVCFTYIKKALDYACSTLLSPLYHLCVCSSTNQLRVGGGWSEVSPCSQSGRV